VGALKSIAVAAALLSAGPAGAQSVDRWSGYIAEASARFGIPKEWIRRVILAESGGRTLLKGRPITSRAGAMGLMQVMPGTWLELRTRHGLGANPHDPRDNILAGTAYLRAMYDRFGYPGLFAAYNAGPTRFAEHLKSGRRLPAETIAYTASVSGEAPRRQAGQPIAPSADRIIVPLARRLAAGAEASPSVSSPGSLFVRLTTSSASAQ
jgi:soluble lytic murein transglycosylase-like protein